MKKILWIYIVIAIVGIPISMQCIGQSQVRIDEGLLIYLPFNGNANDESGNGNHGTVMGASLTTDRNGNENAAYEFDGVSSYISVPNSESLQSPYDELTQVAWIYTYSWSLVGASFGPVFMKSDMSANAFQYRMSVNADHINTSLNNWNNGGLIPAVINFEQWYHIVMTWKNDTVRGYIDGIFIGEQALAGPILPDQQPLEIGRDVPGSTEVFHGKIDDARIYNRALNDEEVQALYSGNLGMDDISDQEVELVVYPNPFLRSTTISYSIKNTTNSVLIIYNCFGEKIETLVNESQQPGHYQVKWDASALTPGIYFYRYCDGAEWSSGTMTLLR